MKNTEFHVNLAMSSECDRDYATALSACTTLSMLRTLVTAYAELAKDAVPVVAAMTPDDFKEFRRGLLKERKKQFAGDAWAKKFGAVLMPLPMMRITEIAEQLKAPFGVAWYRCKELRPDLLEIA